MGILSADLKETLDSVVSLAFTENTDKPLRINIRQCQLLANKASETLLKLKEFDAFLELQELKNSEHAPTISIPDMAPAVMDLHRVLKNAEMLIEDCCCGDHWLEKAIYQGNLKETFAKILYEIEWHMLLLCSFLTTKGGYFEKMQNFDGELRHIEYFTLDAAAKNDLTSLRRLREDHVCDREVCKSGCLAVKLLIKLDAEEAGMMDKRIPVESNSPLFLWVKPLDTPDRSGNVLGSGSFAEVKETKWLGHTCAWKEFKFGTSFFDTFKGELAAMAGLDHPHIVHVVSCTEDDVELGIIMERLNKSLGTVLQNIHREFKRKGDNPHGTHASPFSIPKSVDLMLQIGEGLRYIHSKGMAHRDLNPKNILLLYADPPVSSPAIVGKFSALENTPIVAKIADFGLTKVKNDSTEYGNQTLNTGTRRWMAPEVWKFPDTLEQPAPSVRFLPKKMDVFSFGIICSGILTGEEPYQGVSNKEMYKQMKEGVRPDLPSRTPAMLAALIKKCWDGNPRRRPVLSAICTELRFIKALLLRGDDLTRQVSGIDSGPGFSTDRIQVQGPWPSQAGGSPFSNGVHSSIKRIKVWHNTSGMLIQSIEIEYEMNKKLFMTHHGENRYDNPAKIEIDEPTEYVTQIEGTFGITPTLKVGDNPVTCVTSLTIHTNEKTYGPYGGIPTGATTFSSKPGRIVGFHGRCCLALDSIGCYTVPVDL